MIIENVVAQILVSCNRPLFFYTERANDKDKLNMEIDFLISSNQITSKHNITPIEVKSGKNYTRKSLTDFKNKFPTKTDKPIVIHEKDYKEENGIIYLPIYMTSLL